MTSIKKILFLSSFILTFSTLYANEPEALPTEHSAHSGTTIAQTQECPATNISTQVDVSLKRKILRWGAHLSGGTSASYPLFYLGENIAVAYGAMPAIKAAFAISTYFHGPVATALAAPYLVEGSIAILGCAGGAVGIAGGLGVYYLGQKGIKKAYRYFYPIEPSTISNLLSLEDHSSEILALTYKGAYEPRNKHTQLSNEPIPLCYIDERGVKWKNHLSWKDWMRSLMPSIKALALINPSSVSQSEYDDQFPSQV